MKTKSRMAVAALLSTAAVVGVVMGQVSSAAADPLPEVVMWVQAGPEGDALSAAATEYTKQTGNPVKVELQGRNGWRAKYEAALAAGSTEVDGILQISQEIPSFAAAGPLRPISPDVINAADYDVADIPEPVQKEMTFDGKWYMMPTDVVVETYVYRTDLIPTPPKTWDELRENAIKFTQSKTPGSPTKYGYAYSAGPGNLLPSWRGIMGAYGGALLDDNNCVKADTPETIAAFDFYIGLKNKDQVTPPDIGTWDYPEILVGFQSGILAQASFFSAGMPVLTDCTQSPNVCKNIALLAQPAGPAGSKTRIIPLGIMINAASTHPEAAEAFLKWVTGPVGGLTYTAAGGSTPRMKIMNDPSVLAKRPWNVPMIAALKDGMPSVRHPQAREILEAVDRYAQQAVAGTITPEDAMKQGAAELRNLLGDNAACK
jgi:ABC-type glycerol-3-phosphate transport system substrate-binding protein